MDTEKKLYLRIFSFCIGSAMDILSYFIDTCILHNTDFGSFLNTHKHAMFHKWISTIPCCECNTSNSIAAPNKRSILNEKQIKTIYKIDGQEVTGHVKLHHNTTNQHCLCKISALPGITTENLEIAVIHCLIKTCSGSMFTIVQTHLKDIRKIRNDLVHPGRRGGLNAVEFNQKWTDLETAVLAIAKEISPSYERKERKAISSLKNVDVYLKDITDRIESMEENMKQELNDVFNSFNTVIVDQIHQAVRTELDAFYNRMSINHLIFDISLHKNETGMTYGTSVIEGNEECEVEWTLKTPEGWNDEDIKQKLENELKNLSQRLQTHFRVKFIYRGSIIIHTSVQKHILRDEQLLKSAIQSFLKKIVDICDINTDLPEIVQVDITVRDLPSHSDTVISDLLKKRQLYSEKEFMTQKDYVTCKHCYKQFRCDQCATRRKQIELQIEYNKWKKGMSWSPTDISDFVSNPTLAQHVYTGMETETRKSADRHPYQLSYLSKTPESTAPIGMETETRKSADRHPYQLSYLSKTPESTAPTGIEAEFHKSAVRNPYEFPHLIKTTESTTPKEPPFKIPRIPRYEPPFKIPRIPRYGDENKGKYLTEGDAGHSEFIDKFDFEPVGESADEYQDITDIEPPHYRMCHLCVSDPSQAVYWCTKCAQSMCRKCSSVHRTEPISSSHTTYLFCSDYYFEIRGTNIRDIALCGEVLVTTDYNNQQLVTCGIKGQNQQYIALPYIPSNLTIIDQNRVALTTFNQKVLIVDIQQKSVTQVINMANDCIGITYMDKHLFVGCGDSIVEVDISGEIISTIPLNFEHLYICSDNQGRIHCTGINTDSMYCIGTMGYTVFTVTSPDMSEPSGITIDNDGHALVVCYASNNVHRISPDGKHRDVIISDIPSSIFMTSLCYDPISNSVFIGRGHSIYVYKL